MSTQTDWGSITGGGTNRVSATRTTANSMEFVQGYKFKPDGSTTTLFLPAAGYRTNIGTLMGLGTTGCYWSSTASSSMAFTLYFIGAMCSAMKNMRKSEWQKTRLIAFIY